MELTPEIEKIFTTEQDRIVEIELTYKNGGKVLGTIRKVRLSPLRLVIQKSFPEKGERPKHKVVFDHVTHMQITFDDGTQASF
jgi:hypothetical protein